MTINAESVAVEETLRGLIEAATRGDVEAAAQFLTDDLVLYKVGHIRDREILARRCS